MRAIETQGTVSADGHLTVQVPLDVAPGEHRVIIVLEEETVQRKRERPPKLPVYHISDWPEDLSLRCEDMYGDDGR